MFLATSKIRKPIFMEKSINLGPIIFQNMSFGFIYQFGGGYNYKINKILLGKPVNWIEKVNLGYSSGMEFRLSGFSFYSYPTAFSYEVHYPLSLGINEIRPKHYFSVLFDFQE